MVKSRYNKTAEMPKKATNSATCPEKGVGTMFTDLIRNLRMAAAVVLAIGLAGAVHGAALAQELESPTGKVVLTVSGNIGKQNADGRADFDMDMLEAMPVVRFRTSTPWTPGVSEFEGVSLGQLMERVAAAGKTIKAVALNDYSASVSLESAAAAGAIIAYKVDGKTMPVRDKGPLWIMFPLDDRPELKSEATYSQCVWQLRTMIVTD